MHTLDTLILQHGHRDRRKVNTNRAKEAKQCNAVEATDRHIGHAIDLRMLQELICCLLCVCNLKLIVALLHRPEARNALFSAIYSHSLKDVHINLTSSAYATSQMTFRRSGTG